MTCPIILISMRHLHNAAEILAEFYLIFGHLLHTLQHPSAILHFADKLAAGCIDVVAARLAHRSDDTGIRQYLRKSLVAYVVRVLLVCFWFWFVWFLVVLV